MIKKTITYKDYDDMERTETFMFGLTEAEVIEMNLITPGGMDKMLTTISEKKDIPAMIRNFKMFILKSYGEKSADGRRFMKSEELSHAFEETPAYNILFTELCQDAKKAADFINGILPEKMQNLNANIENLPDTNK